MSRVTNGTGLAGGMALEDGHGIDFAGLRRERRTRVLAHMESSGLDAMVLGRPANVRFASGARQLWRAGAFSFAPSCVVIARTGRVHVLSTWDDGIPAEIEHEDLYGLTWNPENMVASLRAIPGLSDARVVGTDSLTPSFAEMLARVADNAVIADASIAMMSARLIKTADEVACITAAAAIAEAALEALQRAVAPGIGERELLGVYNETISRLGAPTPPSEGVAFATTRTGPVIFRHSVSDRTIGDGELVILVPSAFYAGYEAGLGRTVTSGDAPLSEAIRLGDRCQTALKLLVDACRPGKTGADLYQAWASTGEPEPSFALAHGIGLGAEPPLIGYRRGLNVELSPGMVLSVQSWVATEGIGGYLQRDTVLVTDAEPQILTKHERGAR